MQAARPSGAGPSQLCPRTVLWPSVHLVHTQHTGYLLLCSQARPCRASSAGRGPRDVYMELSPGSRARAKQSN